MGDDFDFLDSTPSVPSLLSPTAPVMLYGAGHFGRALAAALTKRGIQVLRFLDRKASAGSELDGIPICSPDDLQAAERSRNKVIVSIFNRDVSIPEVIDDLHRRGYATVCTVLDVFDEICDEMGDRFWLTSRACYRVQRAEIEEVASLWADDHSRDLYRRILQFRMTGNYRVLPNVEGRQYHPHGIPGWGNTLRLIDAGAYDGDTLRELLASGYAVDALAAFEPNIESFSRLCDFVRTRPARLGNALSLFPCGLWSATQQLRFSSKDGEASRIAEGGETLIQCVRLDDVVPAFAPTLIKLDIEGAEPQALEGAAGMVRAHRPGLAVCVYHRPDHLWRIPLWIRDLSPRYRLYLRSHGHSGFDLVLYGLAST